MTVETTTNRISYTGDGATVAFPVNFAFYNDTDLEVIERDVATGTETIKTLATDYSVSGGDGGTGTLTAVTAPPASAQWIIRRVLPKTQTSDLPIAGSLPSGTVEEMADRAIMLLQELQEQVDRSLVIAKTDSSSLNTVLPSSVDRANKVMAFDANGDATVSTEDMSAIEGAATSAANAEISETNAADRASAAAISASAAAVSAAAAETVTAGDGLTKVDSTISVDLDADPGLEINAGKLRAKVKTSGGITRDANGLSVNEADLNGAAIPGIQTSDNTARANIVLNAFRIAVNGGLSVQKHVDGVVDEFEDETGVAIKTNATYDATNDNYANAITEGYPVSNRSAAAGLYSGTREQYGQTFTLPAAGTIHGVRFNLNKAGNPLGTCVAKLYAATGTVGTNAVPTGAVLATSGTLDVATVTSTPTDYIFTFGTPYSASASDYAVLLEYSGGDVNNLLSYSTDSTSPSHSGNITETTTVGSGWTFNPAQDSIFAIIADITLISETTPAIAQPDDVFIVLWQEDGDTVTLNTDIKTYASRDGGTTWTQITLTEEAVLSTGRILTGTADISAQPSGTSMQWKITAHNAKGLKVHGVGLEWS